MKEKKVIWSFICAPHIPTSEDPYTLPTGSPTPKENLKVAIFKRSAKVEDFKSKWAPIISDSTDGNIESAARRSVEETTKLSSADMTTYVRGKPFRQDDKTLDTTWIVHSFSFILNDAKKSIVLDSKNTESKWILPSELKKMDVVPAFDEGMKRSLPGPVIAKTLKTLRNEKEKLDEELALMAIDPLRRLLQPAIGDDLWNIGDTVELWKWFRIAVWTLIANVRPDQQPAMSHLLTRILVVTTELIQASSHVYRSSQVSNNIHVDDFKRLLFTSISQTINEREKRTKPLTDSFLGFIIDSEPWKQGSRKGLKLVATSYTSSVAVCLNRVMRHTLPGRSFVIAILKSRPRYEGINLAKRLFTFPIQAEGFNRRLTVELMPDASLPVALSDADFLIVSAERVAENGDVYTKASALAACVLAKTLVPKCKVIVVCTIDKIGSPLIDLTEGNQGMEDGNLEDSKVMNAAYPNLVGAGSWGRLQGAQVRFKSAWFEYVPSKWVDVYVTEGAVVAREKLGVYVQRADERAKVEKRLFADL